MRGILWGMAQAATSDEAPALDVWALASAGWPEERILPDAAAQRVYSTLERLRKLGLGPYLVRDSDGYRLDPDVPIRLDR
jgi:hypothetical protein